jgi:hypothetical protein
MTLTGVRSELKFIQSVQIREPGKTSITIGFPKEWGGYTEQLQMAPKRKRLIT